MTNPKIIRDNGSFFRAVNEETGYRSQMFTAPNQAGRHIGRKYGKDAERVAFEEFCGLTD